MREQETLGSYLKDNKALLQEYMETRLEIFRLSAIRTISKSGSYLLWLLISLFLIFLIILFAGIVLGLWLSVLTHSYIAGFGLTTLLFVILFAGMAIFRNSLFVNPIIQGIIARSTEDYSEPDSKDSTL